MIEFLILIRAWLRLKIGNIRQLAKISGFSMRMISWWVKGKIMMSEFVADVLLTSMGVIERKLLMGCGK